MSCPFTSHAVPSLKEALSRLGSHPNRQKEGSWTQRPGGLKRPLLFADTRGCLPGFILSLLATQNEKDPPPPPLTVVVTPDEARAVALASELEFFLGPSPFHEEGMSIPWATVLPQNADMAYGDMGPDTELELERLAVLFKLSQGFMGPFLILSGVSFGQRLMPRKAFEGLCDMVGPGETVDRRDLVAKLVQAGYRQMPIVEDSGCFAVRGAIVDVYSPAMSGPCRLEFDGDTIIDLRRFHTESQRTVAKQSVLYIHPVRQTVLTSREAPRPKLAQAAEAGECPSSRVNLILDEIRQGVDFFGSESLLPAFHCHLEPLWSFLPQGATFLEEDSKQVATELDLSWARLTEAHQNRLEIHRLSFPPEEFFSTPDTVMNIVEAGSAGGWNTLEAPLGRELFATQEEEPAKGDGGGEASPGEPHVEVLETQGMAPLAAQMQKAASQKGGEILAPLAQAIREWRNAGLRVFVAAAESRNAHRLEALLKGYGLDVHPMEGEGVIHRRKGVMVGVGTLTGGVIWPGGNLSVISEDELFGIKRRRRRAAPKKGQILTDLGQLKEGDYVVHGLHGVGRYGGLTRQEMGGIPADYLIIRYAGKDKLYLPVHRFDQVQRYVGAKTSRGPRLDKLGGQTWEKKKTKISKEVLRLAEELLRNQAQRNALPGHAFGRGGELFTAFEATFPFEETPDQANAIEATLSDMMTDSPMDRLVCGDVGYGKTEVALRAAVLSVLDGKQIALLAPTAVLVEQHFSSFQERLRSFPITVDALSRFRGKKRQSRTLEALAEGKLDIVVGTHRLLSSDVRFKDLGLIIIDEEQRFGVAQKEKLKSLRSQVDVLSLTATPIPRTMQMALSGIKDMSIIATPPPDRQSIRTYVCPYSPSTVTRAIRQEMERGGQVFFVVPKIGGGQEKKEAKAKKRDKGLEKEGAESPRTKLPSIDWWYNQIREWVPRARVSMAHGKMDSRNLEKTMVEFVGGEQDILVATSLIESGLDIPKANTMLVMHADRFGLAQLYQLRGRVGRSHTQAYCYFMVDTVSGLTQKAKQRLAALERLSRLGSAFNLATEDLEIRGAGDVLGKKQSGGVAAVGFDTYFNMLEEAVAALKGEPIEKDEDCDLSYDLPAYLPEDWIPEPAQRLQYYQALARGETPQKVADLLAEMEDLFGAPVPDEGLYLAEMTIAKIQAERLGGESLELSRDRLSLTIGEETPLEPAKILKLLKSNAKYSLRPPRQLTKKLNSIEDMERIQEMKNTLKELEGCVSQTD